MFESAERGDPSHVATGSMTPGQRFERTYAQDDRSAPHRARGAVAALPGLDEHLRRDLTIVVSELVANAVRHAPRVDGGEVVLAIMRQPEVFRVEVRDPGDGFDPTPDPTREGGLGLVIVSHIARSWGLGDGAGTVVWCEVAIPA
jgi:anti-sigma regulatory factor (Ser/Thr protein kinase)